MAASDARPVPLKNTAFRVTFAIFDADGDLVAGAAGLDSEISKDGGTFVDCTNEATEIASSSGMYYLDLTATEMDADTVAIIVKTSTSGAKTTPIVLYPAENTDIPVNVKAISDDTSAADNLETATDGGSYNIGGGGVVAASVTGAVGSVTGNVAGSVASVTNAVTVGTNNDKTGYGLANGAITAAVIATNAIDADALAADAVSEIQSGLATAAALADIDNLVDDLEARLTATRAGYLDNLTNLDATVSSRLSSAAYTAPDNAGVGAIKSVTDKLNTAMEIDGAVYRFTANALEQAPASGSCPTASDIADAVWDEPLAAHLSSGSTGQALNGAGAAGDPWITALPGAYAEGSAGYIVGRRLCTLGTGGVSWTYTLTSSVDAAPIADAHVWVTTDTAGSNVVAAGYTDAFGQLTFMLDAGTYYVWRQKSGWTFQNPDVEVIA